MSNIHPTAIIHETAQLHESVQVGPYCVIGEDVSIDEGLHLCLHLRQLHNMDLPERSHAVALSHVLLLLGVCYSSKLLSAHNISAEQTRSSSL